MLDTGDIVSTVAAATVRQLSHLAISRSSELAAYLRTAIDNAIRSQWRRSDRAPLNTTLGESFAGDETSPLDRLIGAERLRRYEAALQRLEAHEREAIVGRFEFAYGYDELARFLGKPSAGAARVAVHRAVKRLTEQARHV